MKNNFESELGINLHVKIKPYREEINSINRLEAISLKTLIFSYLIGVIVLSDFKLDSLDIEEKQGEDFRYDLSVVLFGIMILINTSKIKLNFNYLKKYFNHYFFKTLL